MEKISCIQTYIPIRNEPSHRSEQVSQLIFGETATVLKENAEWYYILTDFDKYSGWIEKKAAVVFKKEFYELIISKSATLQIENGGNIFIPVGSKVNFNRNKKLIINNCIYKTTLDEFQTIPDLINIIQEFIGTPYLWGGRTPFGTDCSGFTQIVMKCMGIELPRDASQQAEVGVQVQNTETARQGDLAFFENEEGKIVHVGIVLKNNQIVHASGSVRVDKLDSTGIFNESAKAYSHKLNQVRTYRK